MRFSPGSGLAGAGKVDGGTDPPSGPCRGHPGEKKAVDSLLFRNRTHQQAFEKYLTVGGIRSPDFHHKAAFQKTLKIIITVNASGWKGITEAQAFDGL
jgi:hypothetical protein